MEKVEENWAYMVRCVDGSLYTGWTKDLLRRVRAHNGEISGGAKYTRHKRPVTLVWSQAFESKREAMACEYRIKQLSKAQKEKLVRAHEKL